MSTVLVNTQRVATVAHIVALVTVVLDLEVLGLDVVDHVVTVLAGVAALQTGVRPARIVALHPQCDYLTQFSLVGIIKVQTLKRSKHLTSSQRDFFSHTIC